MPRQSYFYASGIVQFVFSLAVASMIGFDAVLWAMPTIIFAILTIGIGILIRKRPDQPLTGRGRVYFVVIGTFLVTIIIFVMLSGVGGVIMFLIISGISAFVAAGVSTGRSAYTAYKRKESWTRRNGTVCYRHKDSWDVSAEEVPSWFFPATFFLVYFLIVTPLIMFSYPFNLFLVWGFSGFLSLAFLL